MSARRVSRTALDWAGLAQKIPPEQKAEFASFKSKCDSYARRVATLPEKLPAINWDAYNTIAVPGLVDSFKKQYESLSIQYPSEKDYYTKIDAACKKQMDIMDKYTAESKQRVAEYKAEIKELEAKPRPTSLTCDEFGRYYPNSVFDPSNPRMFPYVKEHDPQFNKDLAAEEQEVVESK